MDSNLKLSLYREMLKIRIVEERIASLYPEGEMRCPVHLCTGQEAAEVGSCLSLAKDDYVISGHRAHGHYLAKGGDLNAMIAEMYGKATGCAQGKGGSMHLIDLEAGFLGSAPIVGSTIPIGVGAALSSQMKGEDRVTMIFFGDGAMESGVLHESFNFASLKKLPVVFVCENNYYSVYSPMNVRQPDNRPLIGIPQAHGIESYSIDGNDIELVYTKCKQLVDEVRAGAGPRFIELTTYRWLEHCGPNFDNHIGYRTEEEYQIWNSRDPVKLYENKLQNEQILEPAEMNKIQDEIIALINSAIDFAKSSPFPEIEEAAKHVYA